MLRAPRPVDPSQGSQFFSVHRALAPGAPRPRFVPANVAHASDARAFRRSASARRRPPELVISLFSVRNFIHGPSARWSSVTRL